MGKYRRELSTLSLVASILVVFIIGWSAHNANVVTSSDYKVKEELKLDTVRLYLILQSFVYKGALYTQRNSIDNEFEREALGKFILSPAAIAYYIFSIKKSEEASQKTIEGEGEEKWRDFFLRLSALQQERNPWEAAKQAKTIMNILYSLDESQLYDIANELDDLNDAMKFLLHRKNQSSILLQLIGDIMKERSEEHEVYLEKLKKEIG